VTTHLCAGCRQPDARSLWRFADTYPTCSDGIQDDDFSKESEDVFRERVEPAILEIEDAYKSNNLLMKLAPNMVEKSVIPTTSSALGLLLAQATELPAIVAGGLGLLAGTSAVAIQPLKEWRDQKRAIESNQLFFYYQAGKMLTDR